VSDTVALYGSMFGHCQPEWEAVPLSAAIDFREGPGILAKDFREQGVPLLRLRNIERPFVELDGCNFLDPAMVDAKWNHFRVDPGDLLVSTSGTLGRVSIATPDSAGAIPYTGIIRMRPARDDVDAGFIRYFLTSPLFQVQAEALAAGSVLRHFGPSHLREMWLPLPPLNEQRAIAEVLGALDDKLEQNRRTARALERLARAIFRAWFVDFEPVKAKGTGATSFPSMPQPVFDALSTRFVDSDVGPVPEGWEVKAIAKVATFLNGLALQKYPPRDDGSDLRVIKIAQLRRGSTDGADLANGDVPEQYVVNDRDLLFSWSGTLEAEFWFGGKGALNQHLFKVTSSHFPSWLCLLWIRQHLTWFRAIAASKATTMGHIKRSHLQEAKVVVPPVDVIQAAGAVIGSVYELHAQVMVESRKLAGIRDLLLPKLLSGQVRVQVEAGRADES
jgi:type I restriction enzyme S subunit